MRLFFHSEQHASPIIWKVNREVLGVRMIVLRFGQVVSFCASGLGNAMSLYQNEFWNWKGGPG